MTPLRYLSHALQMVSFLLWMWLWETPWRFVFIPLFILSARIGTPAASHEARRLSHRDWVVAGIAIFIVVAVVVIAQTELIKLPSLEDNHVRALLVIIILPLLIGRFLQERRASSASVTLPPGPPSESETLNEQRRA